MYMGKIEVPIVVAEQPVLPRGSMLLGLAMLAIAVPAVVVRLVAHLLVRDVRLAGRAAQAYAECVAAARRAQ
jgi:hypothetical protein